MNDQTPDEYRDRTALFLLIDAGLNGTDEQLYVAITHMLAGPDPAGDIACLIGFATHTALQLHGGDLTATRQTVARELRLAEQLARLNITDLVDQAEEDLVDQAEEDLVDEDEQEDDR